MNKRILPRGQRFCAQGSGTQSLTGSRSPCSSGYFPAGSEQFPAGSEQFPVGSERFPVGSEGLPDRHLSAKARVFSAAGRKRANRRHDYVRETLYATLTGN